MSTQRILLFVLIACLPVSTSAQETPAETREGLTLILVDHVKPAQVERYEATLGRITTLLQEHDAPVAFRVSSTGEFRYVHLVEVGDWAGVGGLYSRWADVAEKLGEPFSRLHDELMTTIDHSDTRIVRLRSDLSYTPEKSQPGAEEVGSHFDFYHLAPGNSAGFEKAAKGHAAQLVDLQAPGGFRVYETVIGAELPSYVVDRTSGGPADFLAESAKAVAAPQASIAPLEERVQATLRRLEKAEARPRADLSYPY